MHQLNYAVRTATVVLIFWTSLTHAQVPTWEVGGGLGAMYYKGDIAPQFAFRNLRPAGNLLVRHNFSQAFTLRANAGLGRLVANDTLTNEPFQQARGTSFRSGIQEASLLMEYNFLNFSGLRKAKNWTPYLFAGLGLHSAGLQNEVEKSIGKRIHFPLGAGVKYEFKRPWSVGLEFGTRFTSTDYLDGYGPKTFNGTDKLGNGNPDTKDLYSYIGVLLTYRFYRITCPE